MQVIIGVQVVQLQHILSPAVEHPVKLNVLAHKLSYPCQPLASIPPYCGDILHNHHFVEATNDTWAMALSRSNNEVTIPLAPGGNLFGCRAFIVTKWLAQLLSNDLSSSTAVSALLAPILHEKYVKELDRKCIFTRILSGA